MKKIDIYSVKKIVFSTEEVLKDAKRIVLRKFNLRRALLLGNLYKRKVTLVFKNFEGKMQKVDSTVWAVGDKFVSLKAGITIPITSIISIEY